MSEQLKPCPFCSSSESEIIHIHKVRWGVICSNCGAMIDPDAKDQAEAIAEWNKRHLGWSHEMDKAPRDRKLIELAVAGRPYPVRAFRVQDGEIGAWFEIYHENPIIGHIYAWRYMTEVPPLPTPEASE